MLKMDTTKNRRTGQPVISITFTNFFLKHMPVSDKMLYKLEDVISGAEE